MNKDKITLILRITLIAVIITTLAFIFVQSLLPPETSQAESDAVGEIIEEIIPPETPPGDYVQKNIRSIAHFFEFAVLGFEVALYVMLFERRALWIVLGFLASPTVALLDETLQKISDRAPEISDVWTDVAGYSLIYALTVGAVFAAHFIRKRIKKNGKDTIG